MSDIYSSFDDPFGQEHLKTTSAALEQAQATNTSLVSQLAEVQTGSEKIRSELQLKLDELAAVTSNRDVLKVGIVVFDFLSDSRSE